MKRFISTRRGAGKKSALLATTFLSMAIAPSTFAITASNPQVDSFDVVGGGCFVNMSASVGYTTFDSLRGDNADQFGVRIVSNGTNSLGQQDNFAFEPDGVINIDARLGISQNRPFTAGPLTAQWVEVPGSPVVRASVPIDLAAMNAAGGPCATLAGRAGFSMNQAPVADAGTDRSVALNASFNTFLTPVNSSDADGDNLTFSWQLISGLPSNGIPQSGGNLLVVPPSGATTQVWEVTVDDGNGGTDTDRVSLTWTGQANQAPVLPNIGNAVGTVGGNDVVSFITATDADGDSLTFTYDLQSGPASSVSIASAPTTVVNGTGANVTITPPTTAGTQVYLVTATDPSGATDTQTVNVVWAAANQAPTADAGPDQTGTLPAGTSSGGLIETLLVNLDGTGSSDPDAGDTLTYAWALVSGPNSTFTDATKAQDNSIISVRSPSTAGTQVWRLTVTDNDGLTSTDDVNIVWSAAATPANTAPVLPNLGNAVGTVGGNDVVSFITASDADGDSLTFTYDLQSGPASSVNIASAPTTVVNGTGANVTITPPTTAGTQVYLVTATDPSGATDTQTVNVVWAAANQAPTADAGPDQTIVNAAPNTRVTLDGSGSSDPEGDTLTYAWTQISGPSVTLTNPTSVSPSFVYQPAAQQLAVASASTAKSQIVAVPLTPVVGQTADTFRFQLIVSDGTDSSVADEVEIIINENNTPTADAGDDETFFNLTATDSFTLDGSGSSDPDGDTLTYAWTQSAGRTLTIADANTATPSLTYGTGTFGESFTFDLVVSDGALSSVADSVTITVDDNRAPVATIAPVTTAASSGGTVTLDATGSTDADGNNLTYSWVQLSGPTVTLMNGNTATPSFTAPNVTSQSAIVFEVTVSDGSDASTAQVSVTVMPAGSITIVQNATGGNDSFGFSSSLSDLNGTITTVSGTGSLIAENVVAGTYVVTAADERADGFALTGLTCNDSDSTTDLTTRRATIQLSAGENVVCTYSSVNARGAAQTAIRQALTTRNTLILSNQPKLQRRLDRLKGNSAGGSINAGGLTLPGSNKLPVQANISDRNASFAASLDSARHLGGSPNAGQKGSLDVWVEGALNSFTSAGRDGDFSVIYAGVDYLVSDNVLIGGLVQYDQFDQDNDLNDVGGLESDGFMVGPYVTTRVSDNVYLDARAAWGTSSNKVASIAGQFDEFDTERALLSGTVTGEFELGSSAATLLRPEISVHYISETQQQYTDLLGVDISEQTIAQGEVSFAPRIQHSVALENGWIARPYGQVRGIYSFGDNVELLGSDSRARFEGGVDLFSGDSLTIGVSAFADGIGADNFSSEGGRISVSITPR